MSDYLTTDDIMGIAVTIKGVRLERVKGKRRPVLYFEEYEKGLLLTREMAENLTEILGPHKLVEEFFANERKLN